MKRYETLLLLALLAAFPPLATDMYLPAIPLLEKMWNKPLTTINLTLIAFFISYCFFLLVYGPVSDRMGRKPPLIAGISIFIFASVMCGFSNNIYSLIAFRVLQAAGAASASALSLAITKDLYDGNERQKILAYIGVIMALAPMLAPVIGGWVMNFISWRWIFAGQGLCGIVALIGVIRMKEPLKTFSGSGFVQTIGIYTELFRNRRYLGFAVLMSLIVLPHFAFIAGSSSIYISGFGMTEQEFGFLFGINAAAIMAGSIVCTRVVELIDSKLLISLSFAGVLAGSLLMISGFIKGPYGLTIPMAVISFFFGVSRPPSNNMVLEQVDKNAGAASSLLIFIYFITGALSMWIISLSWESKIFVIGVLGTFSGMTVLVLWSLLSKNSVRKDVEVIKKAA